MNNYSLLSGKYELVRALGTGTTSSVYLARHIPLQRECAIKFFPKDKRLSLRALSEAQLLRSLHHPGIPEIYDIGEDENNCYLVEEYVPGESLDEYLCHQQSISQNIFFTICKQICEIFDYLHNRPGHPIFYQDLKPEHLILCSGQWKLIDFGCLQIVDYSENSNRPCGNLDFSAPEYFSGNPITVASDIYSIGKLLEYLAAYVKPELPPHFRLVIQKCIQPDPSARYSSVQALSLAIQKLNKENGKATHLLKNIAVIGAVRGCGTTHIGIALTSAANALGFPCYYVEKDNSRCLRTLKRQQPHMAEHPDGYYTFKHFNGFPAYGPGIRISTPNGLLLTDYGTEFEALLAKTVDKILLICPDAVWLRDHVLESAKRLQPYGDRLCLLCNPGNHQAACYYARQLDVPVYRYFYDEDPFRADDAKRKLTQQLLCLPEKGKFQRIWDFLAKNQLS